MLKRNIRSFFLFSLVVLLTACSSNLLLTQSKRFEKEADALLSADRTSEALLAYHQAVKADPANHTVVKKLIPLYQQQGRQREAANLLALLTEDEKSGLEPGNEPSLPEESEYLHLLWINRSYKDIPVGLAVDEKNVVITYLSGKIVVMQLSDGRIVWSTEVGEAITSAPMISAQFVIFGCESGKLYALDGETGKQIWSAVLPGPIFTRPLMDQTRVYVGSYSGKMSALEQSTGKVLWQVDASNAVLGAPVVDRETLYFGTTGGMIYALDRTTGKSLWEKPVKLAGSLEASPVVASDMLLMANNDSRLYALDLNGKAYYWQYSMPDSIYASPLVKGDRVYVFSIGQTAAALDIATGNPLWEQELPVPVRSTPQLAGEMLYFAGVSQPYLFEMETATGKITAKLDTADWIETGPLLSGKILLLAGKDGSVIAYRVDN
jgi:outer membrane protein assembly factor BamB